MFFYPFLIALLFLSVISQNVSATPANPDKPISWFPIEVESQVDKSQITIGDKILYQITVTYPTTGSIELPSILGNLGAFEVKDYHISEPKIIKSESITSETNGNKFKQRQQTWSFTLSTYTVGPYTIPPQVVLYTPEQNSSSKKPNPQTLHSEPISITVERTTAETLKDIIDISNVVFVEHTRWPRWLLLFIILASLIGTIVYFLLRKKQIQEPTEKPRLPPYEEAIESLEQLKSEHLVENQESKTYCFRLSAILRTYLSRQYPMDAIESTTEEFLEKIQGSSLTSAQQISIQEFCSTTDMVKFANQPLSPDASQRVLKIVEDIVEETHRLKQEELQNNIKNEVLNEIVTKEEIGPKEFPNSKDSDNTEGSK